MKSYSIHPSSSVDFRNFRMGSFLLISIVVLLFHSSVFGQRDSTRMVIAGPVADTIRADSSKIIEDAALDIGQNRGLFIVTPDQKLQLRILGSVRFLALYENRKLPNKNSYSTIQIPVASGADRFPNTYFGLEQTRLGFEVTRSTNKGNVFVRLETDFAGADGFRIRHAYGQFSSFLFGQTWSLFTHIVSVPATVDFGGPTGSSSVRTPQVRYSFPKPVLGWDVAVAAEYFKPDVNLPNTLAIESFLLIPDLTGRIDRNFDWGLVQISALLSFLSGRTDADDLIYLMGWGLNFSTIINSWKAGKWYFQTKAGQGITRYMNDLAGQGLDIIFDPISEEGLLPFSFGGYLSYEHSWRDNLFSNFTYGASILKKYSFSPAESYYWGGSFRFNTFWSVIDGAKIGLEYIYGNRHNADHQSGSASRFNFLVYYDF